MSKMRTRGPFSLLRRLAIASLALGACAGPSLLAAPSEPASPAVSGSGASEPAASGGRPATVVPAPPAPIACCDALPRLLRRGSDDPDIQQREWVWPVLSRTIESSALRPFLPTGFSQQFTGRMAREARRYRRADLREAPSRLDREDSVAEAQRATEAERIVVRSIHRTFDGHLARWARAIPGLRAALEWAEDLGTTRSSSAPDGAPGPARGATEAARPDFAASMRLKIDAHPRIWLGAELSRTSGRLEVPLLRGDPLRLTVEHRLGARSRVSLSGGAPARGSNWLYFTLNLAF